MGYSDKDAMRDTMGENDLDRKHDVFMANLNQDIWKEQFKMQSQEYTSQLNQSQDAAYQQWLRTQSPEALMQHAAAAGINPAAFYSQVSPTSPSSPSISVPSPSGGHSGSYGSGRGFSTEVPEIVQLSQAMQSMSNMGYQGAQAADTIGQLNANIRSKVSDANLKDMQASYQGMYNAAYQALGDDKKMAVFMRDFNQGLWFREQGDLVKSQEFLNRAMEYYYNNLGNKTSAESLMVVPYMNALIKNIDSSSELNTAQKQTQTSVQAVNFAQSNYYKQLALSEQQLRSGRIEALDLSNDLATISKFIAGNEQKYSDAVLDKRIEMYAQQLEHAGIINQQEWQNLRKITTQANWAERQEFRDYVCGFFNAANGAISNVVGSQGHLLNRLSAKERNELHERFIDNMRSNGLGVTPYAPPSYNVTTSW